jgi:EAL domain-containing protein (putative c-di-GMP-specific phosphodiesterase class I)/GGDEF domain-containing protein
MKKTQAVRNILKKHNITSWFQPIVNLETRELLGWEAFTRGPSIGPVNDAPSLFDSATEAGVIKPFDLMCMHNAALCFEQLQLQNKLFVNLSNEMLVASSRLKKQVGALISDGATPPARMVLEINEKNAGDNIDELIEAVHFFHEQGFEVAIDNLGELDDLTFKKGDKSNESATAPKPENNAHTREHSLWSELKPDYIKIDRRYIENINGSSTKQAFVSEIVAIARSINSTVIAEGVETLGELQKLKELGVLNIQGYLIQKPELAPLPPKLENIIPAETLDNIDSAYLACDLIVSKDKIESYTLIKDVLSIFEEKVFLNSIAVVKNEHVVGMVYRMPFLEKLSKRQRRDILLEKPITSEMDRHFLSVDSHVRMEQVSRLVTSRARLHSEHDFAITNHDNFLGIGTAIDLLRKITQMRIGPDRQANLLTMLPGNVPIGDCVKELLDNNAAFTIGLLDLSNFKPYNNHYDHTKGDELLVIFADLLRKHINSDSDFAGHIGGDDFVVIVRQSNWKSIFKSLFNEFNHRAIGLYTETDQAQGGIQSTDRYGEAKFFDFVTLSAGVMDITDEYFESFQSLLTMLIQLKQRTKRDKSIRIAYQHKESISLLTFENEQFHEVMAENNKI